MARIVFSAVEQTEPGPFPDLTGVASTGSARSRAVIGGADRPILLWRHDLQPDSELTWTYPPVDHVLYVFDGVVNANGVVVSAGGAVVVEHGASAALHAKGGQVSLIHYHVRDDGPPVTDRSGGHVHVVTKDEAFTVKEQTAPDAEPSDITMYADSGCASCAVWLSKFEIKAGGLEAARHFHTEDEVMFVLDGAMRFGARQLGAGGAVAIDRETTYGFTVGRTGVSFLNFRPSEPFQVMVTAEGNDEPVSERAYVMGMLREQANAAA